MESGAVAADANIVVVGGQNSGVYAFKNNGDNKWSRPDILGEIPVAAKYDGKNVYATDKNEDLHCLSGADGTTQWTRSINARGWAIWQIEADRNADKLLIRTNSDIIICDSNGIETHFYDVAAGNSIIYADISDDGSNFAVSFNTGGTNYVEFYQIGGSRLWTKDFSDFCRVCIDASGDILVSVKDDKNYLLEPVNGDTIAIWDNPGTIVDAATDQDILAVGKSHEPSTYEVINRTSHCYYDLPALKPYVVDTYEHDGMIRYTVDVVNKGAYPRELFDPAPDLPPCGLNNNSSRSWVSIYDQNDTYLSGYCVILEPQSLYPLYFTLPESSTVEHFYLTIDDRRCDIQYTSELAPVCICYPYLPDPEIAITDIYDSNSAGQFYTTYELEIINRNIYPPEMFVPSPELPPCGANPNASRTWASIYEKFVGNIYTYCAKYSPEDLDTLGVTVNKQNVQPNLLYVKLQDRKCGIEYTSGAVSATQICPTADFNDDCVVNFKDFATFAQQWLQEGTY